MKYNKSQIMKRAHEIYKEGKYSFSQSLSRAWTETKIKIKSYQRFEIAMIDRQTNNDQMRDWDLCREIVALKEKLNVA